ncbi:uncharacterized protein N7482_010719 [Penicillium canariense]|uniref:C6 transcription factor n=1 Tax=Penicillium canariense TaxID=189055 RepID=A0A9W9HNC9_9EURO|nr:uncharacterized protein N7482_010719 [Penicillium canariense]KAJ5151467.1 hypothetical protein N7482_010719 [Penicillium canariense]
MHSCRYQGLRSDLNSSEEQDLTDGSIPALHSPLTRPGILISHTDEPLPLSRDHLPVPDSTPNSSSPSSLSYYSPSVNRSGDLGLDSCSPGILDATELDLLSHYLTHTSQIIPFDNLDLYALSVGMPNLAFNSKPVMSSLIALAAACKTHDIVKQAQMSLDGQTLMEVRELLVLAECHHGASLQHIQQAVLSSDWYDNILANAALMVLYASASHSIRVRLAAIAKRSGQQLPNDVLPQHSQWISFTRAAHTASTAVLKGIFDANRHRSATISPPMFIPPELPEKLLTPQNGPSDKIGRLFLPLVASTYGRAFENLRRKIESTAACFEGREIPALRQLELDACSKTLLFLEECASASLSTREVPVEAEVSGNQPILFDEFFKVSPWLGRYMVSVTSITSPRALRRTIMSFLNKAPAEFLSLIQSVLDSSFAEVSAESWMARGSPSREIPSLRATQLLALDIFAHWLVLVMLLDGVWWIGDIGQWELGQVVCLMKSKGLLHLSGGTGETWWPESMYSVNMELTPNVDPAGWG